MQTVSLFDTLTIERSDVTMSRSGRKLRRISVSCSVDELACDESNLCYRAAQEFFSLIGEKSYNVSIHIEKRIPIAAGLAGGSTDAAATLIGLNRLYEAGLSDEKLCLLGARLGADVPFCIRRGILIARGVGEKLAPCPRLPECAFLIVCEGERVPTPWAYRMVDEHCGLFGSDSGAEELARLISEGGIERICGGMRNIFEGAVLPFRARAAALKRDMESRGALIAMMSGSGPSVFGVFANTYDALAAKEKFDADGVDAIVCEPYYES